MVRVVVVVVVAMVVVGVLGGRETGIRAQESLSISGVVWEDLNANGVRDPEDPPLAGVSMRLQTAVDFRSSLGRTGDDGTFVFMNVQPGRHIVQLDGSRQFYWTYPARAGAGQYTITVNVTTASVSGVDFGVHRPEEHIAFAGDTWIYGQPDVGGEVRAFIGGADCTGPTQGILPPGTVKFSLAVISSDLDPACGDPGDVIRFEVGGLPANETAIWEDRSQPGQSIAPNFLRLTLTVGPPFGYFMLESKDPDGYTDFPSEGSVRALVDGKECGSNTGYGFSSILVVRSTEYADGCGEEGARVEIVAGGVAVATVTWATGLIDTVEVPWQPRPDRVPASDRGSGGSIMPPSVGDGGLR